MHAIQDDFPFYGYRRVTAQLRADGTPVNRKRVARLMKGVTECLWYRQPGVTSVRASTLAP
jgi:transposase InsO family protein